MSYVEKIEQKLFDQDKWPLFVKTDYLNNLRLLAGENFQPDDVKGSIAAILIYQQLTEEIIKVILENCRFYIQVKMLPSKIEFRPKKKLMFGQLIKELEDSMDFQEKDALVEYAKSINTKRIDVVHKLIENEDIAEMHEIAESVKHDFEDIFTHCNSAISKIRVDLANLRNLYVTESI